MADFCGAIGKKESGDFLAVGGQVLCCQDYEKYLDGFRSLREALFQQVEFNILSGVVSPLR